MKKLHLQTWVIILMAVVGLAPLAFPTKYHHQNYTVESESVGPLDYQKVNITGVFPVDQYVMSEPVSLQSHF